MEFTHMAQEILTKAEQMENRLIAAANKVADAIQTADNPLKDGSDPRYHVVKGRLFEQAYRNNWPVKPPFHATSFTTGDGKKFESLLDAINYALVLKKRDEVYRSIVDPDCEDENLEPNVNIIVLGPNDEPIIASVNDL